MHVVRKDQKTDIKEIVFRENLPAITTETRDEAPGGSMLKQEYIHVSGRTLAECKKIYDQIKQKKPE